MPIPLSPIAEEALTKSGPELFKELLRFYEFAHLDDYYRNGVWRNELMKADIVIIDAHRTDAGAPDPRPLEEVIVPEHIMTLQSRLPAPYGQAQAGGAGPASTSTIAVATTELRLLALFVAKHKLEPAKTKILLSTLTPPRRRYILSHFKPTNSGSEATTELEAFIRISEKSGAWDTAAAKAAAESASTPTAAQSGMQPQAAPVPASTALAPAIKPGLVSQPANGPPQPTKPTGLIAAAVAEAKRRMEAKAASPAGPTPAGVKRPLESADDDPAAKRPAVATPAAAAAAFGARLRQVQAMAGQGLRAPVKAGLVASTPLAATNGSGAAAGAATTGAGPGQAGAWGASGWSGGKGWPAPRAVSW